MILLRISQASGLGLRGKRRRIGLLKSGYVVINFRIIRCVLGSKDPLEQLDVKNPSRQMHHDEVQTSMTHSIEDREQTGKLK